MIKRSDIEIMAPAGSYESLLAAIEAGADYVIVGRAIYDAEDPVAVARSIAESIKDLI